MLNLDSHPAWIEKPLDKEEVMLLIDCWALEEEILLLHR
jgi:hypothetical protein